MMPWQVTNLEGQTFGYLTVLKLYPERESQGGAQWVCRCVCGKEVIRSSDTLKRTGNKKSCGCKKGHKPILDIRGRVYGFLTVQALMKKRTPTGGTRWRCLCTCGKLTIVERGHLRKGGIISCGCRRGKPMHTKYENDPQTPHFHHVFNANKHSADQRGLPWELTKQQARKLMESNCYYCGKEPEMKTVPHYYKVPFVYNGLDRKDNSKGYTLDNVVPCCWQHNDMKGTLSHDEFIDSVISIVRHLFLQDKNRG